MAIKNFWSLNVDEAILSDKLNKKLGSNYQIFFPVNSQLKDIDLIIYNLQSGNTKAIQVKGSRSYEPRKSEVKRYGDGRTTWNVISGESVFNPENQVDFFVFVLHVDEITTKKRQIIQQYLIIPIEDFRKLTKKKQVRSNGMYHYFFWIRHDGKEVLEINNKVNQDKMDYTKYLNNFDLLKF